MRAAVEVGREEQRYGPAVTGTTRQPSCPSSRPVVTPAGVVLVDPRRLSATVAGQRPAPSRRSVTPRYGT